MATGANLGAASVCHRCASRGPTCCQPGDVPLAALTPGDVRRIAKATGLAAESFSVLRHLDAGEREALKLEDPVLAKLADGSGNLRSLAKRGGVCVFHSGGCTLAYGARPLLCRRFPLVRWHGKLLVRPGGDCLAVEEAADLPSLLESLGLTAEELARIDRRVQADLSRYRSSR